MGNRRPARGVCLVLAALFVAGACDIAPPDEKRPEGCRPLAVEGWEPARDLAAEFARYGNDNSRTDDWTGGDGNHSVRLPDGRTVWFVSDPYLDLVHPPPNPRGETTRWRDTALGRTPAWTRNAALVMSPDGRLESTLLGPGPSSLLPDPVAPLRQWRWPVHAVVEPRTPGAREQVLRVLLWHRQEAADPWVYGVPLATEVATFSLPSLRLEGINQVDDQSGVPDPDKRVLYGTAALADGEWTYVFGGSDGRWAQSAAGNSRAYAARAPRGRLGDPAGWRFWDGESWQADADEARPVLGDGGREGVASSYTVVRRDGTWLLLTMDSGGEANTLTSYWSCSPRGPWQGPGRTVRLDVPEEGSKAAAYNAQAHPEFAGGGGLLLSYDVNWLDGDNGAVLANVNRNVDLYRPRFIRLRLG